MMTPELITSIIAFLGTCGGYIKVSIDRNKTAQKRDTDTNLINYKIEQLEKRADKNDKVFEKILQVLEDIKVEIATIKGGK